MDNQTNSPNSRIIDNPLPITVLLEGGYIEDDNEPSLSPEEAVEILENEVRSLTNLQCTDYSEDRQKEINSALLLIEIFNSDINENS